jgi:hypothetical protein
MHNHSVLGKYVSSKMEYTFLIFFCVDCYHSNSINKE